MPQFRSIDTDGAHISFLDSGGDDRGAPIVFVPGFTCIAEDYAAILPAFGRRTVVVELGTRPQRCCRRTVPFGCAGA